MVERAAEDFPEIAKRLKELEEERQRALSIPPPPDQEPSHTDAPSGDIFGS